MITIAQAATQNMSTN